MGDWGRRHRQRGTGLALAQRDADDRLQRAKLTPEQHQDRLELAQRGLIQASAHAKAAARVLAEYATADPGDVMLIEIAGDQLVKLATGLRVAGPPKAPMYKAGGGI